MQYKKHDKIDSMSLKELVVTSTALITWRGVILQRKPRADFARISPMWDKPADADVVQDAIQHLTHISAITADRDRCAMNTVVRDPVCQVMFWLWIEHYAERMDVAYAATAWPMWLSLAPDEFKNGWGETESMVASTLCHNLSRCRVQVLQDVVNEMIITSVELLKTFIHSVNYGD